jgi:hypothetical protein
MIHTCDLQSVCGLGVVGVFTTVNHHQTGVEFSEIFREHNEC